MTCSKCNSGSDKVIDSRRDKSGTVIRRRRECLTCTHRWTTYEMDEEAFVAAVESQAPQADAQRAKSIIGMLQVIIDASQKDIQDAPKLPFRGFRGFHPPDVRRMKNADPDLP